MLKCPQELSGNLIPTRINKTVVEYQIAINWCVFQKLGVEGVVRGLEGIHLADRCILTKLE
jgi:hypothetical protein